MNTSNDDAIAFLGMARDYQMAASRLFDLVEQEPKVSHQFKLSDPIYFLFFQSVELGLKAFLLFHGEVVPKGQAGQS